MKARGGILVVLIVLLGLLAVGAVLIHSHAPQAVLEHLHGGGHGAPAGPGSAESSEVSARALQGVSAIGRRWDESALEETVALYAAVHRDLEWPGVLAPETIAYGSDTQQTFELFRPEQAFSEPGPVFVFLHGNGLGSSDPDLPGSDGLLFSHMGKLAATFGGIGVNLNYRDDDGASLATGAEDLRLVLAWLKEHIADYGGDPNTLVVFAHSEGARNAAAYLFNEGWQLPVGPGVAAAILSSGDFGSMDSELADAVIEYQGARVPLALWYAEYDPPRVSASVADLHELLCRKYDGCPWYQQLNGHNHLSQIFSLGTADTSALNAFIRFYHTVR